MIIGNKEFKDKTYIMGILNVTPDSFSDGGLHNTLDSALFATEQMIAEGADIIDIGGESTRPGHTPVSPNEEVARVCPILTAIKNRFDIPISIDTQKAEVTLQALKLGADLINDVNGFEDEEMVHYVAKYNASVCTMHSNINGKNGSSVDEVIAYLNRSAKILTSAGVDSNRILLDPGVGFGKTVDDNLDIMRQFKRFCQMDYPILLGTSRKSFIGATLDIDAPKQRVYGTLATTALAHQHGALFVRVHDVRANYELLKMLDAMK